jgi:signal transduction histidine kinase
MLGARVSVRELQAVWLVLLRVAWLPLVLAGAVAVAGNVGPMLTSARVPCSRGCFLTPADVSSLVASGVTVDMAATWGVVLFVSFAVVWLAVALLVYWRAGGTPIGLCTAYFLAALPLSFVLSAAAAGTAWSSLTSLLSLVMDAAAGLFLFTFPDGRFTPRWTAWLWLIGVVAYALRVSIGVHSLDVVAFPGFLLSGIAVQAYRYRRVSTAEQRQQTRWVISGTAVALLAFGSLAGPLSLGWNPHGAVVFGLWTTVFVLLTLIPLSIASALLRSQLWGVEPVVTRTLVYALLAAVLIGLYISVVAVAGALFQRTFDPLVAAAAAAVVAVLLQPLHLGLRRAVNRLLYGSRDDPYRVMSELGHRIGLAVGSEATLRAIVKTVAAALRLPYVAIDLVEGGVVASSTAAPPGQTQDWPLLHQQLPFGRLLVSARSGELLSPVDRRLLSDLAVQVSIAARAAIDQAALQKAREDLVMAREEERRRLRRDLHDGLGATLAALTLKAGSARSLVDADPADAKRLLREAERDLHAAVGEVRRVVDGMRPAALDERGLVPAIEDLADGYTGSSEGLAVTIECDGALDDLPAATELAAYRIVQEALANAVRHSRGSRCHIRLVKDRALQIEVSDDGVGLNGLLRRGVGLSSMRERAEELGGTCRMDSIGGSGVKISASLPLRPGRV